MTIKKVSLIAILSSSLFVAGCASTLTGDSYSRDDARQVQTVEFGQVQDTRLVVIEGTKSPIGGVAGAAVGGIAGSSIGDGRGSNVAAVIGAVAGGLAGAAAEEQLTKSQGIEIVVRLESGEIISVVQGYEENNPINAGDSVRVLYLNGETRIAKNQSSGYTRQRY